MLLLYPPGLGVSVPYGSPVWSKLLIAVEEEGNYWVPPVEITEEWHKPGVVCPVGNPRN
jgi:hypothetical protein